MHPANGGSKGLPGQNDRVPLKWEALKGHAGPSRDVRQMSFRLGAKGYCFFSGVAGVTGCEPPVDFGPGVTPAPFSEAPFCVELFTLLAALEPALGFAPAVGPLPASFVDVAPPVGPLPASALGCANAGPERPSTMTDVSRFILSEDMRTSCVALTSTGFDCAKFRHLRLSFRHVGRDAASSGAPSAAS